MPLQALVHAVEAFVDPVLVSGVPFLVIGPGTSICAAFGVFAPSSLPSFAPTGPFLIAPTPSSHAGLLSGRLAVSLTVPGRHAA